MDRHIGRAHASEEEVSDWATPGRLSMDDRRHTLGSKRAKQVGKLTTGGEVRYIRLGLHIFEVDVRPQASIKKVESIDKQRRVQLARVAMKKARNGTGIVYPV